MVVLACQIPLDGLQHVFHLLESGFKAGHLVLGCGLLEQFHMTVLALGSLVTDLADDVVRSMVDQLNAASEIDKLLSHRASVTRASFLLLLLLLSTLILGSNWLLVLIDILLLNRDVAASSRLGGLDDKLEDFKRVRILGGCSGDTEVVAGWESNLKEVSHRHHDPRCRARLPYQSKSTACRRQ